ncbi:MAG: hypothetical protein AB1513_09600 [Pseudomonadota bacterium]
MTGMLSDILLQSFLMFVGVGCVFALLFGIGMMVRPHIVLKLNDYTSRWIATDRLSHPLDRIFRIERFVYRNHRVMGTLILGGSLFVLYVFLFNFDQKVTITVLTREMPRALVAWLLEAMVILLSVGSMFAAIVGALLFVRPSLMRGFEAAANRWRATDETLMRLDVMRDFPDRFIERHIRVVGMLVVLGSLYALSVLGIFLR